MRLTKAETAKTLAFLDRIYGNLIPKGATESLVEAWMITLDDVDLEPGDLFEAAKAWAKNPENQYAPKPGQLIAHIREAQERRLWRRKLDNWERNGGLIRTGGVLVNRNGEMVDEDGNVIREIGEGRSKDPDLDQIVRRITSRRNVK